MFMGCAVRTRRLYQTPHTIAHASMIQERDDFTRPGRLYKTPMSKQDPDDYTRPRIVHLDHAITQECSCYKRSKRERNPENGQTGRGMEIGRATCIGPFLWEAHQRAEYSILKPAPASVPC